jgi:hypothetical protein
VPAIRKVVPPDWTITSPMQANGAAVLDQIIAGHKDAPTQDPLAFRIPFEEGSLEHAAFYMSVGEPLIMVTAFLAQAIDASVPADIKEKEDRVRAMHKVLYEKAGPGEKRSLGREYRSRFARDLEAKLRQTERLGDKLRDALRRGDKSVDEIIQELAVSSAASTPSCSVEPVSRNADRLVWKITPDRPVRLITAWAAFVDGVGTEHGGGGSRNAWDDATEITVRATVKGDTLFLTYDRIRKRADGTQTASKTVRTSAPAGATFEWRALSEPAEVTREYLTLWEGLFRKDGHPVKRIIFAVRVAGRNDEPPSPLGPPFDAGPQPFPSSLFDKSP